MPEKNRNINNPRELIYKIIKMAILIILILTVTLVFSVPPVWDGIPWLALILFFGFYDSFKDIVSYYDKLSNYLNNNKIRIYITLFVALGILFIMPSLFSEHNEAYRYALMAYIAGTIFAEISNLSLIDDRDFFLIIIGGLMSFSLDSSDNFVQIFSYLSVLITVYILTGVIIKVAKEIKQYPDYIINIIGLLISVSALIFQVVTSI